MNVPLDLERECEKRWTSDFQRTAQSVVSQLATRSDPEYCRRSAQTCREMAEKAANPRDRKGWLRLAQEWSALAEQGERAIRA
jgi:hypothetical protein